MLASWKTDSIQIGDTLGQIGVAILDVMAQAGQRSQYPLDNLA
jgi:hypothetical protein